MFKFGERGSTVGTALVALAGGAAVGGDGGVRLSYGKGEKADAGEVQGGAGGLGDPVYRRRGRRGLGGRPAGHGISDDRPSGGGASVMGSARKEERRQGSGDEGPGVRRRLTRPFEAMDGDGGDPASSGFQGDGGEPVPDSART